MDSILTVDMDSDTDSEPYAVMVVEPHGDTIIILEMVLVLDMGIPPELDTGWIV